MTTPITIQLDLEIPLGFSDNWWYLDIDDLRIPVQHTDDRYQLTSDLPDGKHVLKLVIRDRPQRISIDDPDLALIIHYVQFQHIDYDFKIFSEYHPRYPKIWMLENHERGIQLAQKMHSNYLSWDGEWIIEFETPIYQWVHRRLERGWLI